MSSTQIILMGLVCTMVIRYRQPHIIQSHNNYSQAPIANCSLLHAVCSLSFHLLMQFTKRWIVQNAGTIRWQHVTLVHQNGFAPIEPIITVPDLSPGEQAKLTASYPAVENTTDVSSRTIDSQWKLFYKGRPTSFSLQLSVYVFCETTSPRNNFWFDPYCFCIPQICERLTYAVRQLFSVK